MAEQKIPVTIVTGFLGSGKTTLLNRILREDHGLRICVIENEFAEDVGVESLIIKNGLGKEVGDGLFELPNGCMCCSMRDDLIITLQRILERRAAFDYILVEPSGMASPGPIAAAFFEASDAISAFKLDGIIAVVDAVHLVDQLDDVRPDGTVNEAAVQLACADVVLLNKCDLAGAPRQGQVQLPGAVTNGGTTAVDAASLPSTAASSPAGSRAIEDLTSADIAALETIEDRIRSVNATAVIHRCVRCDVPLASLLNLDVYGRADVGLGGGAGLGEDGNDALTDDAAADTRAGTGAGTDAADVDMADGAAHGHAGCSCCAPGHVHGDSCDNSHHDHCGHTAHAHAGGRRADDHSHDPAIRTVVLRAHRPVVLSSCMSWAGGLLWEGEGMDGFGVDKGQAGTTGGTPSDGPEAAGAEQVLPARVPLRILRGKGVLCVAPYVADDDEVNEGDGAGSTAAEVAKPAGGVQAAPVPYPYHPSKHLFQSVMEQMEVVKTSESWPQAAGSGGSGQGATAGGHVAAAAVGAATAHAAGAVVQPQQPTSVVVLIGRGMDKRALQAGLEACQVPE